MRVLVIGGTLFIGKALVQSLLKAGHEVTVMHRKNRHKLAKKVKNLMADRNDPAAVEAAIAGQRFDVVFDNVYDWERGTTVEQVMGTARALGAGLSRYVFMSSVAAYGDGLNHQEGDALAPDHHADAYVRNKAMSERALFRYHQRTGFPVVTLRPPYVYGPENPFYREQFFWDRMRAGRQIVIPGDGRRLMQMVYVKDVVAACMAAMDTPGINGHAFNVASPRPITQEDLVLAMAAAAKKKVKLVNVPRTRLLRSGGNVMKAPLYFATYYDLPPITEVINKAQRILKLKPTPLAEGLRETYLWYLRNFKRPKQDYSFEDAMLASVKRAPETKVS
ncbi:MAG: NAD-dependent epimerase/dehydratase family protein [Acidobacteria bacterium]|nr:NAD-dependent epimerase/dehydratase family protein [Acidobacteriota bacterium]